MSPNKGKIKQPSLSVEKPVGSYLNELQILRQVRKKTELCDKVAEPCNAIKLGPRWSLAAAVSTNERLSLAHN